MGFTITKTSWILGRGGDDRPKEVIFARFWALAKFLQDNSLTTRRLASSLVEVDENFGLNSDDLTDEGLALIKSGYNAWLKKVDKGMDPNDVRVLQKALDKIRSGA
jgi:hypothetical protein